AVGGPLGRPQAAEALERELAAVVIDDDGADAGRSVGHDCSCRTRRSSGSRKCVSSGSPPRRNAALSSTELTGRGAGRGGSRSSVAMGRTRPGSRPATSSTLRANSNQETAPWFVTWKTPGRRSTASRRIIGAQSSAKLGWPRWSSTNASFSCSPARRRMVFTMLLPYSPHTHDVRTMVALVPSTSHSPPSLDRPYTETGLGASHSTYGSGF